MTRVLVLGEDTRSFLSVIRSLGKAGYTVDVVCFDNTSPALKSKYISKAYLFNYQAYTSRQWLQNLISLVEQNDYAAVVPCDERAIFPLAENQQYFPQHVKLAIPNQAVLEHLFDKNSTKAVAQLLNVPHAKGELLNLKSLKYVDLSSKFGEKFVVKPTLSFKSESLSKRQKVEIITSKSAFEAWKLHCDLSQLYLVERYFTGTGEGVSVVAANGKVLAYFAHARVNEPNTGGGSSYRKSIPLDSGMAEACKKICEHTQYTGVGMFEFKKDQQTGDWILIEVNARFWGSLPLAIYAGIDFPAIYIDSLLNQQVGNNADVGLQKSYKIGAYARSLTNDIFDIKKEIEFNLSRGQKTLAIKHALQRCLGFSRILIGKEKIDSYDATDIAPFKEEVYQFYTGILQSKLPWNKPKASNKPLRELLSLLLEQRQPSIKFVCYGNIMRSPFACKYLSLLCQETGLNWNIDSYGFHLNENRPSPVECVKVAKTLGINLQEHASKWIQQEHIKQQDIIFVFDELNLDKLKRFYKVEHVYNLAEFIPPGMGIYTDISDPYGHGEDAVRECYTLIAEAVKNIFEGYRAIDEK